METHMGRLSSEEVVIDTAGDFRGSNVVKLDGLWWGNDGGVGV